MSKLYQQKTPVKARNLLNDFRRTPEQVLSVLQTQEDRALVLVAQTLAKRLNMKVPQEEQAIKTLILYIYNIMKERHSDGGSAGTT